MSSGCQLAAHTVFLLRKAQVFSWRKPVGRMDRQGKKGGRHHGIALVLVTWVAMDLLCQGVALLVTSQWARGFTSS